jgi:NAD(P)H dehydrogenase (quinone)
VNIFIVYAHPEPQSLNHALAAVAVDALSRQGHTVELSDLYSMGWTAVADGADFCTPRPDRLKYSTESKRPSSRQRRNFKRRMQHETA